MADFKIIKGENSYEYIRSIDGLLDRFNRQIRLIQEQVAERAAIREVNARLDKVQAQIEALYKHLQVVPVKQESAVVVKEVKDEGSPPNAQ